MCCEQSQEVFSGTGRQITTHYLLRLWYGQSCETGKNRSVVAFLSCYNYCFISVVIVLGALFPLFVLLFPYRVLSYSRDTQPDKRAATWPSQIASHYSCCLSMLIVSKQICETYVWTVGERVKDTRSLQLCTQLKAVVKVKPDKFRIEFKGFKSMTSVIHVTMQCSRSLAKLI